MSDLPDLDDYEPSDPDGDPGIGPIVVISADPDQAWKALGLVNEWIKHAETKAVATLAAAGVVGGVLYNLVKGVTHGGLMLNVLAVICATSVILTGTAASMGLIPRLRVTKARDNPTSPLYFNDIARDYAGDGPTYAAVLHALTGDSDNLTRHIAHQVHSNAAVAHRKYKWANRAVMSLVSALVSIAALAIILGVDSI